jgi:hypothetical protein
MPARNARLSRLRRAIDASPVRRGILREAYEGFTMFGELLGDEHIDYEVVMQALRGGEEAPLDDEAVVVSRIASARLRYEKRRPRDEWPPSVRALLFDEALFEPEPIRELARAAIACEVAWGGDVENEAFAARFGIPSYGCVAMHVWRLETKLTKPPYEDQAKRLFVRLDNLRGRIPHDDPRWIEAQAAAIVRFYATGELPDDEVHLEGVLTQVELDLMSAHRQGRDVKAALKLLGDVAASEGEAFQQAMAKLSEAAKGGRLRGA